MAFTSQFALSVELSRVLPIASLASFAGSALLDLVRDFRSSGSDLVTEIDLAVVFGRCIISAELSSSFKTAIKVSPGMRLAGIVELVLEGAGPSISHGIDRPDFFPMIVQVSLLTHVHDISTLATSLAETFELRSADRPRKNISRYDALLSTLKSLQEQTIAYPWERLFDAFETEFADLNSSAAYIIQNPMTRKLPHVVLGALLDTFVAVQRLPEAHFLEIKTTDGLPTLAIWAHHVLGLTVEIEANGLRRRIGAGMASVSIVKAQEFSFESEVILYNEAKGILFRASEDVHDDPVLEPATHHSILGLGHICLMDKLHWGLEFHEDAPAIVLQILHKCIASSESQRQLSNVSRRSGYLTASNDRLIVATQILFPKHDISHTALDQLYEISNTEEDLRLRPISTLICALAMVSNLDTAKSAPLGLSAFEKARYIQCPVLNQTYYSMTPAQAFETLAFLLTGDVNTPVTESSVVSSHGWSLCLSSVSSADPGMMKPDLFLFEGVPTRNQERRHLVLDTPSGVHSDEENVRFGDAYYNVTSFPGDSSDFRAFFPYTAEKRMIATTDGAFRVFKTIEANDGKNVRMWFRLGLRYMQDLYWSTCAMPFDECQHGFSPERRYRLPPDTWAFRGCFTPTRMLLENTKNMFDTWATTGEYWRRPETCLFNDLRDEKGHFIASEESQSTSLSSVPAEAQAITREHIPGCYVHVSRTAGNPALRWLLLLNGRNHTRDRDNPIKGLAAAAGGYGGRCRFDAVYTRRGQCCPECAIDYIRGLKAGESSHVLLIT